MKSSSAEKQTNKLLMNIPCVPTTKSKKTHMKSESNSAKIIIALVAIVALITTSALNAQSYTNAVGLRAGGTTGLTYKHRFGESNALEVILQFNPGVTALYEKYYPTKTNGLEWYIGAGAHFSQYRAVKYYTVYRGDRYYYKTQYYGAAFGIDAIAGLEYKIPDVPLSFSLDVKPNVEFSGNDNVFMYLDPGLGIKLAF
jgi:hypothetical protein